jgi:thioesterase domain-containing protein
MDALCRLQATLHTEIPISKGIDITVGTYDNGCLVLHAPLAPNINHKDTAFAGSLNAVATLAGWSLLWLVLDEAALVGKIVIQDSTIEYLRPVTRDFAACCCLPESDELTRFLTMLRKKARARLQLQATISEGGGMAVRFTGRYVAHITTSSAPTQIYMRRF